jgi:hypothetical protein
MAKDANGVEIKPDPAAPTDPGVKTKESPAPEIDYQKEFENSMATITKLSEDNENYKKGILKAKGKLPEEEVPENPESVRIAEELAAKNAESIALATKLANENKELKIALANKAQVPNNPPGTGSDSAPYKAPDGLVTPAQRDYFKKAGWSEAKIEAYKKNLQKKQTS